MTKKMGMRCGEKRSERVRRGVRWEVGGAEETSVWDAVRDSVRDAVEHSVRDRISQFSFPASIT